MEDGDVIHIDITNRRLTIDVTGEEFARRKKDWVPVRKPRMTALAKYAALVTSADTGAVVDVGKLE